MEVATINISALTPEECSDLMRRGACFHCHQIGHISQNCPKKQGNNNYNHNQNDNYSNQNKGPNNNQNNNNNQKKWSAKEAFTNIQAMDTEEREKFADLTLS